MATGSLEIKAGKIARLDSYYDGIRFAAAFRPPPTDAGAPSPSDSD